MKKIFSVAHLHIGSSNFSLAVFNSIPEKGIEDISIGGEILETKTVIKYSFSERFVGFYFLQGSILPRPSTVYNRIQHSEEENPRSADQIERDAQYFILIDTQSQKVFFSDYRKKKDFEEWLAHKIKEIVIIKNIIDKDHFLNELRSIHTVYLSASPNLYATLGILGPELTSDRFNYGVGIKNIGVSISFQDNSFPNKLKEKINEWIKQKENSSLEKLEVTGRSDSKFERVFNAEGIIDKISIETFQQDDGLFDPEQIFESLIQSIKE